MRPPPVGPPGQAVVAGLTAPRLVVLPKTGGPLGLGATIAAAAEALAVAGEAAGVRTATGAA